MQQPIAAPAARLYGRRMTKHAHLPVVQGADARTIESMVRWIANTGGALGTNDLAAAFGMPPAMVEEITSDPAFAQAVSGQAEILLRRDGTRAAVSLLVSVVRNTDAALGHRMKAAELILTRTVAPASSGGDGDGRNKDLSELSTDELRKLVDQMEGQLAERAEPIGPADGIEDATVIDEAEGAFD